MHLLTAPRPSLNWPTPQILLCSSLSWIRSCFSFYVHIVVLLQDIIQILHSLWSNPYPFWFTILPTSFELLYIILRTQYRYWNLLLYCFNLMKELILFYFIWYFPLHSLSPPSFQTHKIAHFMCFIHILKNICIHQIFIFYLFSLLEYNCFTMLC